MARVKKAANEGVVEGEWLASLRRPYVRLLIDEHAPYFTQHGVKLEGQKKDPLAWTATVHRVTVDHQDELPLALREALLQVVALDVPEAADEFKQLAIDHRLDLGPEAATITSSELAVVFYIWHPQHFASVALRIKSREPNSFDDFYDTSRSSVVDRVTDARVERLRRLVGEYFEAKKQTRYAEVHVEQTEPELRLSIIRGSAARTIHHIDPKSLTRATAHLIPDRCDILVLDPRTGRLSVKSQAYRDVKRFREMVGDAFFDDPEKYQEHHTVDCQRLLKVGRKLLQQVKSPAVDRLRLSALRLCSTDPEDTDVHVDWTSTSDLVPALDEVLASAKRQHLDHVLQLKLSVKLADQKREAKVTLKPPNKVAVGKGAPRDVIHELLRELGFLVPPPAVSS